MSRLTTILATIFLVLAGLAAGLPAGLPAGPNLAERTTFSLVHRSVGLGRDTVREDDRLERRDCKLSIPVPSPPPSVGVNAP